MTLLPMDNKDKTLLMLVLITLLPRVILWFAYEPVFAPDSWGYIYLAENIITLDFSGYDGVRTPGYSLFLLLCGLNYKIAWLGQAILGIATSVLLFKLGLFYTRNNTLSLIIGLLYGLRINRMFLEAMMLTETLAAFLLTLSVYLVHRCDVSKRSLKYYLILSIVTAFAGLTRPNLLFLIPLYFLFFVSCWLVRRVSFGEWTKPLLAFTVPAVVMVFSWLLFNKVTIDYFGLSTARGFILTSSSGAFMELAPDEYATIRDIYLKHRKIMIARTGWHPTTIGLAKREIQEATGLSYMELNSVLTELAIKLFREHPILYAKNVATSWVNFWKIPTSRYPDLIKFSWLRGLEKPLWWIQQRLLIGLEFIFLFSGLWYIYSIVVRRRLESEFCLLLITVVLLGALSVAMVQMGGSRRHSLPFQPLIPFVVVVWARNRFYEWKKERGVPEQ